jgi:hypothetical protein
MDKEQIEKMNRDIEICNKHITKDRIKAKESQKVR